jgi:hypothetical protein
MRDDFSERVKTILRDRVGGLCSQPNCRCQTTGPHTEPGRRISVGVAAHITAASKGGPRYDPELDEVQRRSAENGIWMCQNHGKLVDTDAERFTVDLLRDWKRRAEDEALNQIGRPRPTTINERSERERNDYGHGVRVGRGRDRDWLITIIERMREEAGSERSKTRDRNSYEEGRDRGYFDWARGRYEKPAAEITEWLGEAEPDVSVVFSWEKYPSGQQRTRDGVAPGPLRVVNYGEAHACEIQIGEITGGAFVATFSLIPDLAANEIVERHPAVRDPERDRGTFEVVTSRNIEELVESADRYREHTRLQEVAHAGERLTEEEMDRIVDELAVRIDIEFRITYWNRKHTRRWEKTEIFAFEPNEHRAYVLHGSRREIT